MLTPNEATDIKKYRPIEKCQIRRLIAMNWILWGECISLLCIFTNRTRTNRRQPKPLSSVFTLHIDSIYSNGVSGSNILVLMRTPLSWWKYAILSAYSNAVIRSVTNLRQLVGVSLAPPIESNQSTSHARPSIAAWTWPSRTDNR